MITGIEQENLAGKHILEVRSGRGDTTRALIALMAKYPGSIGNNL